MPRLFLVGFLFMATTLTTTDPLVAGLVADVAALRAEVASLRAAVEARGAPRDEADSALRRVLANSTRGLSFRAADLLHHARVDPELAAALEEATIQTAGEVGCWLRAARGVSDGIAVERLPGRRWQVRHIEHMTCAG